MSRDIPDHVHLDKATRARRLVSGQLKASELPRLQGVLADHVSDDEVLNFRLQFGLDLEGRPVVEVNVSGSVTLTCQRTLMPFMQPLESTSMVALVASEAEAEALPDALEPVFCEHGQVQLIDLIEEEVLLGLPLRPVSPDSQPMRVEAEAAKPADDRQRPFAEADAMAALAEQLKLKARPSNK
jgi:uncharacterized protein